MKLTGKIKNIFLFLWSAAILWIYIGSLINFHQHKIWGRPLLPQLLYAKRDKEQSIVFTKLIKPGLPKDINSGYFDHVIGITAYSSVDYYNFTYSSYIISTADAILIQRPDSSNGLRGPPLS